MLRLDYFTHRRPVGPRLSRLAVAVFVFPLFELVLWAPMFPLIKRYGPVGLPNLLMVGIAATSLLAAIVAVVRILASMDTLRGEGLAIAGMIASSVVCLIALMSL